MSSAAEGMAQQYADSRKLAARARLWTQYMVAETPWFDWLAARLPIKPGDRVLDIGCGPGWFWTTAGLPHGIELTLADQSSGMVDEAVARCRPLGFSAVEGRQCDAIALPFADGAFDVVVAMHMLYHVADQPRALAEMSRVLKPGGTLAVTTNGEGDTRELYALGTTFGAPAINPAAVAFGFAAAERLLRDQFGNVVRHDHPATMRITEPEDIYLALTSYPPGDRATEPQLAAFRQAIDDAFARGGGKLETAKQTAVFLSTRSAD
ncbi:MAG: methyltransferase domain-containing protein [Rubrivivax sp.]